MPVSEEQATRYNVGRYGKGHTMKTFALTLAGFAIEPCHTEALAFLLAQAVLIAVMWRTAREVLR